MVKVTVSVVGGEDQVLEFSEGATVADVKERLALPNHTVSVNGETADSEQELFAQDWLTLAPAVKGG